MATLRGSTRHPITFQEIAVFLTISPIPATSQQDNSRYRLTYGTEENPISFVMDMQGWRFHHSNFERIASTFENVSRLPAWKKESQYQVQPALVESIDWFDLILVTAKDVIVTLFVTPTLHEDPVRTNFCDLCCEPRTRRRVRSEKPCAGK